MKNKPYFIVTDMSGPSGLFLMSTSKHFTEHLPLISLFCFV